MSKLQALLDRDAMMSDQELALLVRFAPVSIIVHIDANRRDLVLGQPDGRSDRVILRGATSDWEALLSPLPPPGRHDLLSLAKNSSTFELPSPLYLVVRNLRVLNRWIDVARWVQ